MNTISRLLNLYEQARLDIDKAPGTIFEYKDDHNGLKILAEIIARARRHGIASLVIPVNSVANVFILPSTKFRHSFRIDKKLDKLYLDGHIFLACQYESSLDSGNFMLMRIDEEGKLADIFTVYKNLADPVKLTSIEFDYDDGAGEELLRILRLAVSELEIIAEKELSNRAREA